MKIIHKDNIPEFSLPLPIYNSIHIADAVCKMGDEFDIYIGLDKKYAEQLKVLSLDENDTELQNKTGDRARFGEGSYEKWYKKGRTAFCVVHKRTDALAALIWFGPKSLGKKSIKFGPETEDKIQNYWHTAVWRSYPKFRGRGIMKNFSIFAIDFYKKYFPGIGLWAGTDSGNNTFIRLVTELGFEVNEENSDLAANWLVMVKK